MKASKWDGDATSTYKDGDKDIHCNEFYDPDNNWMTRDEVPEKHHFDINDRTFEYKPPPEPPKEEVKEEEGKAEEGKEEEGKAEEGKTEESKAEEGKAEEGKTEEANATTVETQAR